MKLLTVINRRFLFASAILLAACSVILFFLMRYIIYEDVNENLLDERAQITHAFEKSGALPAEQNLKSDRIIVKKLVGQSQLLPRFADSLIYDSLEGDFVPHRQLTFSVSRPGEKYSISISQSLLESDDLIITLLLFTLIFMAALFIALYFINRTFSKRVWKPFNDTLLQLRQFDLTRQQHVVFDRSRINEFDELNASLNNMAERITTDYRRLKEFTEDASHEIQTPLSIIRTRIEMLIQEENFSPEQMNALQKIQDAATRLSKLNTALLMLTKIENKQFANEEEIMLYPFIRNKLQALDEVLKQKKILIMIVADNTAKLKMNSALADLLFDNLLGNAIKHNHEDGFIDIKIQGTQFWISNSGSPLNVPAETLFQRFAKNDRSSSSLGLGLALVHQICVSYQFEVTYSYEKNIHTVNLKF